MPGAPDGGTLSGGPGMYRYVDTKGTMVVVDAWEKVPERFRETATKLIVDELPEIPIVRSAERAISREMPAIGDIHWPSFGFGVAASLVLVIAFRLMRTGMRLVLKVATIILLLVMLSGLYLGGLRKSAGLSSSPVADPQQIVEDAQRAAEAARKRFEEQHKALKKIEEQSR
ncbi:MAG: hypothetical protein IT384_25965 [Deltaproteobacteria bacterium]|nr:hypothetical protein [Deltaproteobacteria bacterium]